MTIVLRVLITFISAVASLYFVFWVGGALLFSLGMPLWVAWVASLLAALLVARYVWRHTRRRPVRSTRSTQSVPNGLPSSVLLGALVTGGIAFCAGFFGPILFTPDANQGPLLGIFITGPLGFLVGAAGGAIYWLAQGRRARTRVATPPPDFQ